MLTLYTTGHCPYCNVVRKTLDEMGLEYSVKRIDEDPSAYDELMKLGGKRQVPFFTDSSTNTAMYESGDIVKYLKTTYGSSLT